MDDVSVSSQKKREGAASANHIDRLPEAVEDENGLVEGCLHLGKRT